MAPGSHGASAAAAVSGFRASLGREGDEQKGGGWCSSLPLACAAGDASSTCTWSCPRFGPATIPSRVFYEAAYEAWRGRARTGAPNRNQARACGGCASPGGCARELKMRACGCFFRREGLRRAQGGRAASLVQQVAVHRTYPRPFAAANRAPRELGAWERAHRGCIPRMHPCMLAHPCVHA